MALMGVARVRPPKPRSSSKKRQARSVACQAGEARTRGSPCSPDNSCRGAGVGWGERAPWRCRPSASAVAQPGNRRFPSLDTLLWRLRDVQQVSRGSLRPEISGGGVCPAKSIPPSGVRRRFAGYARNGQHPPLYDIGKDRRLPSAARSASASTRARRTPGSAMVAGSS